MALLDLKGVVKDYPLGQTVVHALRGLDLAIEKGEIVVIHPKSAGNFWSLKRLTCPFQETDQIVHKTLIQPLASPG